MSHRTTPALMSDVRDALRQLSEAFAQGIEVYQAGDNRYCVYLAAIGVDYDDLHPIAVSISSIGFVDPRKTCVDTEGVLHVFVNFGGQAGRQLEKARQHVVDQVRSIVGHKLAVREFQA